MTAFRAVEKHLQLTLRTVFHLLLLTHSKKVSRRLAEHCNTKQMHWKNEKGYTTISLHDGTQIWDVMSYDNVTYPTFENDFVDRMDEMKTKLLLRDSDICILGYMKSGTHWLWEVINMLTHQTADIDENAGKAEGFFEMTSVDRIQKMADPRILSTHIDPTTVLTKAILNSNIKVVVPIRNPKDTAVSLYHHLSSEINGTYLRCGWNKFINEIWFSKLMVYATWLDFTNEMCRTCKERENTFPVIYEHMVKEPSKTIRSLAVFLGVNLSEQLLIDIVKATNFDIMKQRKVKSEDVYTTFLEGYTMFRKGKVGDWKTQFTVAQNEQFDQNMTANIQGLSETDRSNMKDIIGSIIEV